MLLAAGIPSPSAASRRARSAPTWAASAHAFSYGVIAPMPGKCGGRGLSSSSGGGPGRRLLSYNSASSQPRPTARQTVSCADPLSDMGAHHRARGGRFGGNAKARPRGAGGASVITVRFPAAAGVSAETPLTLLLNRSYCTLRRYSYPYLRDH